MTALTPDPEATNGGCGDSGPDHDFRGDASAISSYFGAIPWRPDHGDPTYALMRDRDWRWLSSFSEM